MSIPIYLLECHTWSDGEDDHEEDHNYYYDIKYFYLQHNPKRCIFAWNANSDDMNTGLIMMMVHERDLVHEKEVGSVYCDEAKRCVSNELSQNWKYLSKTHIQIANDFIKS